MRRPCRIRVQPGRAFAARALAAHISSGPGKENVMNFSYVYVVVLLLLLIVLLFWLSAAGVA
jgi:hypothetical protein